MEKAFQHLQSGVSPSPDGNWFCNPHCWAFVVIKLSTKMLWPGILQESWSEELLLLCKGTWRTTASPAQKLWTHSDGFGMKIMEVDAQLHQG